MDFVAMIRSAEICLLAAEAPAASLEKSGLSWSVTLGITCGSVFVLWSIRFCLPKLIHRWRNSPRRLFAALCRAHAIGRSNRRLLRRVARWLGLPHPSHLFLCPDQLQTATQDPLWANHRARLHELAGTMFAMRNDIPLAGQEKL